MSDSSPRYECTHGNVCGSAEPSFGGNSNFPMNSWHFAYGTFFPRFICSSGRTSLCTPPMRECYTHGRAI